MRLASAAASASASTLAFSSARRFSSRALAAA